MFCRLYKKKKKKKEANRCKSYTHTYTQKSITHFFPFSSSDSVSSHITPLYIEELKM